MYIGPLALFIKLFYDIRMRRQIRTTYSKIDDILAGFIEYIDFFEFGREIIFSDTIQPCRGFNTFFDHLSFF